MDNLYVISFNHKITPLHILEKVYISNKNLNNFYELFNFCERIYLQTCHRRELIFYTKNKFLTDTIKKIYLNNFYVKNLEKFFVSYYGEMAFKHLCYVICGLESMIIGETQIVNQIKNSYNYAKMNNYCGKSLDKIFQKVFYLNKLVRTNTNISKNCITLGSICYFIANQYFNNDLRDKNVLLIGTGDTIFSVYKWYKDKVKEIFVATNKNIDNAEKIVKDVKGKLIKIKNIYSIINDVDLIISATSAPHLILKMKKIKKLDITKKLLFIDLAVPRDIDPEIKNLSPYIEIFNLDNIKEILKRNVYLKKEEILKVKDIINKKTLEIINEFNNRDKKKQFSNSPSERNSFIIEKEKVAL